MQLRGAEHLEDVTRTALKSMGIDAVVALAVSVQLCTAVKFWVREWLVIIAMDAHDTAV